MISDARKYLNKFNQADIDKAVQEFDEIDYILPLIYRDLVEITLPKYSDKAKQLMHDAIIENIEKIESSVAFDIFVEIFGLNYVLSKEKPKFLDVFQGLDPTCVATLPWQYFLGTLYKDDREMKFCNLNLKKTQKAEISDFERIIKVVPQEFFVLIKRMQDPTISARASELLTMYTKLSLAEDWGFYIENYKVENGSVDLDKNDLEISKLKLEILTRLRNLYSEFEKFVDKDMYKENNDKNLDWNKLKDQCESFKAKIIDFRSRDLQLVSNFNLEINKRYCTELRYILTINQENPINPPSSTNLNKLINGAGLLKKIGKLKGGYREFCEFYKKWIIEKIDNEQKVIGTTSMNNKTTLENI